MNSKTKYGLLAASGVALGLVLKSVRRPARTMRGDVVLITGGSRGLGLQLAEEFALLDCSLAICARDSAELEQAREILESRGARVMAVPCDVADQAQVAHMVQQVRNHYGRIDALVNNAGIIRVGPMENMTKADFEDCMNTMFWGVVHCSLAVLPEMIERRAGRIVTITSVGGKVSIPHLLPYSCAKHAAVAFSEGLRSEVCRRGVSVTTIAPGLMRTGSHRQAEFKGQHKKEALWFSLGATLPLISMDVARAARQIVRAVQDGKSEKILSWQASLLSRAQGAFPGLVPEMLGLVSRLLPGKSHSQEIVKGAAIEDSSGPLFRAVTALGRAAGARLNERPVS